MTSAQQQTIAALQDRCYPESSVVEQHECSTGEVLVRLGNDESYFIETDGTYVGV